MSLWTKHDKMEAFYSGRAYALQYYTNRSTQSLLETIRGVRLLSTATARGLVAGCAEIIRDRRAEEENARWLPFYKTNIFFLPQADGQTFP